MGIPTQCMKSSKCLRARPQYFANVSLKYFYLLLSASLISHVYRDRINVKLGGINTIPDPSSVAVLTDPVYPTLVMGMYLVYLTLILRHRGLIACSLQALMLSILHPVPMVVPLSLLWSAMLTQTLRSMLQVRFLLVSPNSNT
jgi:hypothetical protein